MLNTEHAVVATNATYEEYMEIEENSEIRHEYYKGRVTAMADETLLHNVLCCNIGGSIKKPLRKKGCFVSVIGVRLEILPGEDYVYPDLCVVCRPVSMQATFLSDPVAVIKVLSKERADEERNEKFERYRQIETLRHYVLVDQYKAEVEHRRREPSGFWTTETLNSLEETVVLDGIPAELKLADIYEDIHWGQ